ncbi:MAG: ABC transporter permease [Rhizobiaceae bacterium MnEN-MB40S]|nr:MAG: ABC transporter permease [Rhizobiaceae bacterium MnEN-MB40S]
MSAQTTSTQDSNNPDAAIDPSHWQEQEQSFLRKLNEEKRRKTISQLTLNLLGVVLFLLLWEATPHVIPWMNILLFPPPSDVVGTLVELVESGELLENIAISMQRVLLGFAIAAVLGIVAGLFTGRIALVQHLSDPVLHGMRSIPAIALVPLSLLWFGIGEASKVALISWGAFFPIWLNTFTGVRDVPPVLVRSAKSLGATPYQTMFNVILPASLPFILVGLRQGIGIALIVLVAAELAGASSGVGYMVATSHQLFRVDIMFIGIATLGFLGYMVDRLFTFLQSRIFPWYSSK